MFITRWHQMDGYQEAQVYLFKDGSPVLVIRVFERMIDTSRPFYRPSPHYEKRFFYTIRDAQNNALLELHRQRWEPDRDEFKAEAIDKAEELLKDALSTCPAHDFIPPRKIKKEDL